MSAITGKPEFQTARLHLRPVLAGDAENLCALDADPEVRRFLDQPQAPSIDAICNEMIPRWQAFDANTPAVGYWVAEVSDTHQFIGWFLLRPPKEEPTMRDGDLELGYRLRREFWGNGFATEGGNVLRNYAFEKLETPRVIATALEENAGSIRVMEKLGMRLHCRRLYKGMMPEAVYTIDANFRAAHCAKTQTPT